MSTLLSSTNRGLSLTLLLALAVGCVQASAAADESTVTAKASQTFLYGDGSGSSSRVERRVGRDGAEVLRGVTEIAGSDGSPTRIEEEARIDATGRLVHAEIWRVRSRSRTDRVVLDAVAGNVHAITAGRSVDWKVGTDEPWSYPAILDAEGRQVVTPVAAWIAFRAAAAAPEVRILYPEAQQSSVVPRDQLAVPTELGATVIVGDDDADVGLGAAGELPDASRFVERVRLSSLGTALGLSQPVGVLALPCR